MLKYILFSFLLILVVFFIKNIFILILKDKKEVLFPLLGVGFVFGFFDTLGVGGFAPTLSYLKNVEKIKTLIIPDILLLSFALPTVLQTFIFVSSVNVNPRFLILGILSPLLGYITFNYIKKYIHERHIKIIVGCGLVLSGTIALVQNLGLLSSGKMVEYIQIEKEVIIYIFVFLFGGLMNFGVGNFSPTLILFELIKIDPRLGFPLMMGSSAVIMLVDGIKLKNIKNLEFSIPFSLSIGMLIAVPLGAYFINSMNIKFISWMVVFIVIFSGFQIILSKR